MSILIKGMEMPKCCAECYAEGHYENYNGDECVFFCRFGCKAYTSEARGLRRPDDCPLVPVPSHGRLIDADALMLEFDKAQRTMQQHGQEYSCSFMSSGQEISTEWYCVEDMLDNAPTIIEAEDEDDGNND